MAYYYIPFSGPSNISAYVSVTDQSNSTLTINSSAAVVSSEPNPSVWTATLPPAVYPSSTANGNCNIKFGTVNSQGAIIYVSYAATISYSTSGVVTITSNQVALSGQWGGWDTITLPFTLANP